MGESHDAGAASPRALHNVMICIYASTCVSGYIRRKTRNGKIEDHQLGREKRVTYL